VSCAKTAEPIEIPFGLRTRLGPGNHVLDGGPDIRLEGQFLGKEDPVVSIGTFCRELCKNGRSRTDRFAVWIVDSGGPKQEQVQSYSPGGANVSTWEGTLAPPDEYD